MATKRITVRVCDVCGTEPVVKYTVASEGRRKMIDLCTKHAAPLEDVLASAPTPSRGKRVFTLEEIEASKKRRK